MVQTQSSRVRFGNFELDLRVGELHGNGPPVLLSEQVFQVLRILIEHDSDLVTRDELKKRLWPNDTVVEFEHSINAAIKKLRKALGDSADEPRYIETIPRRGYRLMVPVEWVGAEDSSIEESSADVSSRANPERSRGGVEGPAVDDTADLPKAKLKVGRLTGKVVSHYRVLEVIGGGGMGLVYRAEDLKLGRPVALKFLPEEVGDDPKARERFDREAHAVSALNHANICTVYDFDEHEGHPFIAMELLQGKTLRDHLADGRFRLTQSEGLEIAIQIAAGLEAAHEKGIIHRDIKPANIFITEKNVAKILDFGVAKVIQLSESPAGVILSEESPGIAGTNGVEGPVVSSPGTELQVPRLGRQNRAPSLGMTHEINAADGTPEGVLHPVGSPDGAPATVKETTLTRTGMKLGTAGYMSPEQIRGEPLDARTDIFSFGLVLYEMATGERAFTGETEAILHDAIEHREPKPVRELAPESSPALEKIIERCLEKEREKRIQSAAEIRACFGPMGRVIEKIQAKRLIKRFAVAAALVVVIAAAVAGILYRRAHPTFKLTDKDTIVLADFQNKTGDPVFDGGLKDGGLSWALWVSLEQTPFLNLLAADKQNRMVAQSGYSAVWAAPLTLETAKQICSATNSAAVVGGSIADAGNQYLIALKAIRCDTGSVVSDINVVADDRRSIVRELGRAAITLRKDLGEPAETARDFNQPLEVALTSSPEALKAVMEARARELTTHDLSAVEYAERAVELDPSFSFAWSMLAEIYANTGRGDYKAAIEKAYALRDRVTRRMRLELESYYFIYATQEWEKAVSVKKELTETYPTSPWAYNGLSQALRKIASYEQSAAEAREAIRLNPDVYGPYYNLICAEIGMEHYNEAEAAFTELRSRHLDSELLREERFWLSFLDKNIAAMQSQLNEEIQRSSVAYSWLAREASVEAYFGHFRKARSLLSDAIADAKKAGQPEGVVTWELGQALDEAEVGNAALAGSWIERSQRQKPEDSLFLLPSLPARLGEIQSANIAADRFSAKFPKATTWLNLGVPCYQAAVELSQNKPANAVESLQKAVPHELNQDMGLYSAYLRGLAFLQNQEAEKASAEFQKVIDHPGVVLINVWGALAHVQLARAYAMMGNKDAARKSYQDFLALWKDADPDIPIYRQAKAEYAKLR